jgi:hypothetical protein
MFDLAFCRVPVTVRGEEIPQTSQKYFGMFTSASDGSIQEKCIRILKKNQDGKIIKFLKSKKLYLGQSFH